MPSPPPASSVTAKFSKANVKSRLTRQAAELWDAREAELDGFDPLVNLLLEACAVEFEKVGTELAHTQQRLLERLATLLNPDVVDAPFPAHAVVQAVLPSPGEALTDLADDAQFMLTKATPGAQGGGQPFFFSPLQPTRLVNGSVQYLAADTALWQVLPTGQKRVVGTAVGVSAAPRRLWLGLALPNEGATLEDLTFYFDWLNEPRRDEYIRLLPGEQWRLGDQVLKVRQGLTTTVTGADASLPPVREAYDFLRRTEHGLRALYAAGFVRLRDADRALAGYERRPYPAELAAVFDVATDLSTLKQPLVWLEVRFSEALPVEAFDQMICALNCFPVLNRRLHKTLFRLRPALNLFPLSSEEPFLAMRAAYSMSGVEYRSTTLRDLTDDDVDTYTLRSHGVGRFDSRTGREALRELLELLRDESRAFAAAGTDFIGSILREIELNLARLEERLDRNPEVEQPVPYLLLRPKDMTDSVYLEYWSSSGPAANRQPAGSRLQVHSGPSFAEVRLLTTTAGGRERPTAEERTHTLRRNLLTRNRLVTHADITAACWAELSGRLAAVQVEKGFQVGATPTVGFVRCIRVTLTIKDYDVLSEAEWAREAQALQASLAEQSAMNMPYEVIVKPDSGKR